MDTVSGTAATKSAADVKKKEYPADPLNIVVVNPDLNDACLDTHKNHCIPTRNSMVYSRSTPPPPPDPRTR